LLYFFLLLNSSIVCVTMVFLVPLPCKHPLHMQNTKVHPCWCTFVFCVVPSPYSTRRTRKDTNEGVFSCSALFFRPTPHAEREKTPSLVSFRVRRCSSPYTTCRMRKDTLVGVFSCSALFLCPTPHAEHEETPTRVSFRVRHLCSILPHTPSTTIHPRWCYFVPRSFPAPSRAFVNYFSIIKYLLYIY